MYFVSDPDSLKNKSRDPYLGFMKDRMVERVTNPGGDLPDPYSQKNLTLIQISPARKKKYFGSRCEPPKKPATNAMLIVNPDPGIKTCSKSEYF